MAIRTKFGKHKIRNSIVLGTVVVIFLALAGPFIYIHFIEGPPPAKLSLPTASATKTPAASSTTSLNGTWNIAKGSVVGYRVSEVLLGQNSTAVGRTSKVWGSLVVGGTAITKATFTVNMASVVSDQSQRNAQFDGRIMDVSQYPTATFTLTTPIELGSVPKQGATSKSSALVNSPCMALPRPSPTTSRSRERRAAWPLLRRFRSCSAPGTLRTRALVDLLRRPTTAPSKFYLLQPPQWETALRAAVPQAQAAVALR